MGIWDIVIIAVISVAVLAVVGWLVYRKVKHKDGGCGCGCSGCSACPKCKKEEKN